MKYEIVMSSRFRKDYKLVKKRGYDLSLLKKVIDILASGEVLPEQYLDHSLTGEYKDYRECHILPDWLLIYRIHESTLILSLTRTGTHSDLF